MSLDVIFSDENLILHETHDNGIKVKVHLEIPFSSIRKVTVRDSDEPILVPEVTARKTEGRFMLNKRWCFAFYENNESVLVLELADQEYWLITFQADNLLEIKQRIMERMKQTPPMP